MNSKSSTEIAFPLIDLNEELPLKRSTIEIFESKKQLGMYFPGTKVESILNRQRILVDSNGNRFRITSSSPIPRFSFFEKIRNIISPFSVCREIDVEMELVGPANLSEFKERVLLLIHADPGDLLEQFRETQEWEDGLKRLETFPETHEFVIRGIFPLESQLEEKSGD